MRILHTADWHLGQELHGFARTAEHDVFLSWLLAQLAEHTVDVLLVAGDVYDVVNPDIDAQRRFYHFLGQALAVSAHLQVIIIAGNHDSAGRLELPRALLDSQRVCLIGSLPRTHSRERFESCTRLLRDASGKPGAICAAVPYLRPGDLPTNSDDQDPRAMLYAEVAKAALRNDPDLPLILTGHLHVSGCDISALSERRIVVGGEEAAPASIFPADAAYVALGHLHKPQAVAPHIRYAGAPFPMSIDENRYKHSVALIDLDGTGLKTKLLATPRPVSFLRVPETGSAPLDEVLAEIERIEVDDPGEELRPFLEVAVLLDEPEPELRRKLDLALAFKPVRLTRVLRESSGSGGTLADVKLLEKELNDLDPIEVFRLRVQKEYNQEPSDEINNAFITLLAGLSDEYAHASGAK